MNYKSWLETVPDEIRQDALWGQEAYRLALFATDVAWEDVTLLLRDRRTIRLAAQLYSAVSSVGANISEGYSRGHAKDRARFYEYALGSARESRTWYYNARHILGEAAFKHRIQLQTQLIRLLLRTIPTTRGYALHDGDASEPLVEEVVNADVPDLVLHHDPASGTHTRLTEHATRITPHAP